MDRPPTRSAAVVLGAGDEWQRMIQTKHDVRVLLDSAGHPFCRFPVP